MLLRLVLVLTFIWISPPLRSEVRVQDSQLLVDGQPFQVRGAAGTVRLDLLKQLGANTVRTYGEEEAAILDQAAAHGLKVILGFWLEHPRRGVSYRDPAFVTAQLKRLGAFVERYRDHPALLLWGLGNEVEAELADDGEVWPALEQAAQLVARLDRRHPSMAVLAEAGNNKVARLKAAAPSIQVLGVNAYGEGLLSLPARIRAQGWQGPWLVTELGARGQWQAARTSWGAFVEPMSGEKAALLERYLPAGAAPAGNGHLVFLWGQKQEVTPTWHSLLLPGGEWSQTAEVLARAWGGMTPNQNRAPRITSLRFTHPDRWPRTVAGWAELKAEDPDGDAWTAEWTVMAESTDLKVAGDREAVPRSYPQALLGGGRTGVSIQGLRPGQYRLFLTLRDGRGAAATANMPFQIE